MVNHINKVNSFIFAHMIFQDTINHLMIVCMLITMAGTIWYSVERLNERKAEAAVLDVDGAARMVFAHEMSEFAIEAGEALRRLAHAQGRKGPIWAQIN